MLPSKMPCREAERAEVLSFLRQAIKLGGTGRGLYISGVPGTGKTATVYEVARVLKAQVRARELPSFRFIEINGMSLPDPNFAFSVLYEELAGRYTSPQRAADKLERHFNTPSNNRATCVLLLDEVDMLVTRKQNILYKLLDWPTYAHAKLVVVAIANTMDLPERLLPRLGSRLGLQRIGFNPYNVQQIQTIMHARLTNMDDLVFDPDAVEFCSRKVAAVSGDVRRALEICRRAAEVAEEQILAAQRKKALLGEQHVADEDGEGEGGMGGGCEHLIGVEHVMAAVNEMNTTSNVQNIRDTPLHARLCLCILALEEKKSQVAALHLGVLVRRHRNLCRILGIAGANTAAIALLNTNTAPGAAATATGGAGAGHAHAQRSAKAGGQAADDEVAAEMTLFGATLPSSLPLSPAPAGGILYGRAPGGGALPHDWLRRYVVANNGLQSLGRRGSSNTNKGGGSKAARGGRGMLRLSELGGALSEDAVASIVYELGACRLLLCSHPKNGSQQVVQLRVPASDVEFALRDNDVCRRALEPRILD